MWRRHEFSLFFSILCVAIAATLLDSQHNYWNRPGDSVWELLRQWSLLGLFSIGAAVVIISGGIDLSTGSVIAFSGTMCATLLLLLAPEAMSKSTPLPLSAMTLAITGTLVAGFLIGSLHAWLITVIRLPPFVATLATLVGLRSLARAMCDGVTWHVLGGSSSQIGLSDQTLRYLATSVWIPAVLLLVVSVITWGILSRTVLGRHLHALGGNETAAKLSGVRTDDVKWFAYALSAMLSSLAGILYFCDQSVADPQTLGRGYELNAIAAAVVGGCSLKGGVGTIPGTLLGALFLRTVIDGVSKVIKVGADLYEGLIVGLVVVFAVVFTATEPASTRRVSLFAGGLGAVTIIGLTALSGGLMALVGARLLAPSLRMDAAWLTAIAVGSTLGLLLLARFATDRRHVGRGGMIWLALTAGTVACGEAIYPSVQLSRALSAVRQSGGEVVRNERGVVVDLRAADLQDRTWLALVPRLEPLQPVSELRLRGTSLTDRALAPLSRWSGLKLLELEAPLISPQARDRLRRQQSGLQIVTPQVN